MIWAMTEKGYSQRRACAVVGIDPRVHRYRSVRGEDAALRARLRELAAERRRFGYRRLHVLLRREGWELNWKKLYRVYREEGLTVRERGGRKRALGTRAPEPGLRLGRAVSRPAVPRAVRDRRLQPRMSRDGGRHVPVGRPRRPGARPHRGRSRPALHGGQRQRHGAHLQRHPRLAAGAPRGAAPHRSGQTHANGFVESFIGRLRDEFLNEHLFESLPQVRRLIEAWRHHCNHHRPHSSLDGRAPREYRNRSSEAKPRTDLTSERGQSGELVTPAWVSILASLRVSPEKPGGG